MTATETPRLKLRKESPDELIDQFFYNWPILDKYAGAFVVADGVTPPLSDLYDGAIVQEATSNKQWIARIVNGVLTKKWLVFPWQIEGGRSGFALPTGSGSNTPILFTGAFNAVNATFANDISNGQVKAPIDGLYALSFFLKCFPNNTISGVIESYITINSALSDFIWTESVTLNNPVSTYPYLVHTRSAFWKLSAGDLVGARAWHTFPGNLSTDVALTMNLVTPT